MRFWILFLCGAGWVFAVFACSRNSPDIVSPDTGLKDTVPPVLKGYTGGSETLRFGSLNMGIGFPVSQLPFMDMNVDSVAFPELHRLDSLFALGRPHDRVLRMAQAVAAESLDVIGLQEVMWYSKNGQLVSDFLTEFTAELQARSGVAYQVYSQRLNDTALDAIWKGDSLTLHFSEGNALLVRPGIAILDTQRVIYSNLLFVPSIGAKPTERGYLYAHLRGPKGAALEAYVTHLEVFDQYRPNQARELKLRILKQKLDSNAQVLLGDLNHERNFEAYNALVKDASFLDTFGDLVDSLYGTCCIDSTKIWDATTHFSQKRIDYVLGKAVLGIPAWRKVALDSPFVNGLGIPQWASDHRMPAVSLSLPTYKP